MHIFQGVHIISDFYEISMPLNPESLLDLISASCAKYDITILSSGSHLFSDGGFTVFCLLAESHISAHYYIQQRAAFIDLFTCGNSKPEKILSDLIDYCMPQKDCTRRIVRGVSRD